METFEEHYVSMCNAIAKYMPGTDMSLVDKAVEYAPTAQLMADLHELEAEIAKRLAELEGMLRWQN